MSAKPNHKKKKKPLIPWISAHHKLVVVNEQTYVEEKSWRLSPLNVALFSSSITLGIILLTVLVIRFSPLNYLMSSGNNSIADSGVRKELKQLLLQMDSLKMDMENNQAQTESIKQLANAEFEYEKDVEKPKSGGSTETGQKAAAQGVPDQSEATKSVVESAQMERELGSLIQSIFLEDEDRLDRQSFVPPVKGVVSDSFAPSRAHYGTDLVAPKGSVVQAVRDGTVIMSSWSADTGHMIGVQHSNNLISWYKHNSARLKKTGDRVQAGEAVAIIGNSGEMSSGPHLHFELWYNGQPIDAQNYIEF